MTDHFRASLKVATQAQHDRVDTAFSRLDLTEPHDLTVFLTVHLACFGSMKAAAIPLSQADNDLDEMMGRIVDDLAALGAAPMDAGKPALPSIHPMALDYMLEGSRLGSKVLARRWAASKDQTVQKANRYFTLQTDPSKWRKICEDLTAIDTASNQAQKIVADTNAMFDMFHTEITSTTRLDRQKALSHEYT